MNEFEIYQIYNLNFINNAIYTVAEVLMTSVSFYLIRRSKELNALTYAKVVLSIFCLCAMFFGIQVGSFLTLSKKGLS